ncbi:hypothetical protein [Ferrimonas pelagia]|uniref:KfrA N-terminal DNA-binding domain-containing protein n=1 Tax=Ferrimonas pelagia TaxID=1177826 RepID=A0ABP9EIS2_9GAMM
MDTAIRRALTQMMAQGIEPSLALLKKHTGHQYPLPVMIQALRSWKAQPQPLDETPPPAATSPTSTDPLSLAAVQQQLEALQQQVTQLQEEVDRLKRRDS